MTDPLLQLVDDMVSQYANGGDDVMQQHEEAMECFDCRDHLESGIHAFKWIRRAEEARRQMDYRGIQPFDDESRECVGRLYQHWLQTCEDAQKWISRLAAKGRAPENVPAFRDCCDEVRYIVERREWLDQSAESSFRKSDAEDW